MGLREQAQQEQVASAPGPVVAAAEQEALARSVAAAQDRHGVPDSAVYYPDREAFGSDNGQVIGKDAEQAIVRAPAGAGQGSPRLVMGTPLQLTEAQYRVLLAPINRNRIGTKDGKSHLEAWDVRRYLTKVFGFGGWSAKTLSTEKIYQKITAPGEGRVTRWVSGQKTKVPNENEMFTVVYEAQVSLTIFNPDGTVGAYFEDGATGDGANMPTYQQAADFALKTALSQALKRCAVNLGDQFGLSLYNHGAVAAQVELTLRPPMWENLPVGEEAVRAAVASDKVRGEQTPDEVPGDDPGQDEPNGLPDAKQLRDEALDSGTSLARLRQIYAMVNRRKGDHPEIGQVEIVNETGDTEPLDYLIYRKIQERKAAGEDQGETQ